MVALLAVGISSYMDPREYVNIPCAYEDAKMVYKVFEDTLGENFKHYCSTCIKDITASELRGLLPVLPMALHSNDIFIFYFSGHGTRSADGRLKLAFSDATGMGRRGELELSEIVSSLSMAECNTILIIDSCYSGSGVCEINQNNQYLDRKISILSSGGAVGTSDYNQSGSSFTKSLSEAVYRLYNRQEKITLNSIYKTMYEKYSKVCIAIGGGQSDVEIGCCKDFPIDTAFLSDFTYKINTYNFELREAMWYSLTELPDKQKVHILQRFMEVHNGHLTDMSWRVRRAVGSLISSIYEIHKRNKIVYKLIESHIWMERCIGYIGGRKDKDPSILEKMERDVLNQDNPMDIVWLSALYISDWNKEEFKNEIFHTNMIRTTWGVIEIWKHFYNAGEVNRALAIFKERIQEREYKQLCLYLYLKGENISIDKDSYPPLIWKYENQIKDLYSSQHRGRTGVNTNKWIWSILKGNWRDQVNLNSELSHFMEVNGEQRNREFLQALKYTPCVEIKMGVMDYFSSGQGREFHGLYKDDLVWGLEEQHPWVVRSALPIYRRQNQIVQKHIESETDRLLYPGVFDLLIEFRRQELEIAGYSVQNLSDLENKVLARAIESE